MQCAAQGVKIRYATQTRTAPPRFTLFASRPIEHTQVVRYVQNVLRERYDLWGVRIRLKSSR